MSPLIPSVDGGLRIPSDKVVSGQLRPPSSKSITQRALNLTLLSGREAMIEQPLIAEDTELFVAALAILGWRVDWQGPRLALLPGPAPDAAEIWCGDNGTMLRFLTAALTTLRGEWILDGSERLRQRTVAPLVASLRSLGARIRHLEEEGCAPMQIVGAGLEGGSVDLDAGLSSQFASALLMAATRARDPVNLHLTSTVSEPYIDLTQQAMVSFGAQIEGRTDDRSYRVEPGELRPDVFKVEADFSAAAYSAAAAVLTGGSLLLEGLERSSLQGDRRFFDVLEAMGARVRWQNRGVEISAEKQLAAVDIDLSFMPDQVPTLAALAPFAKGKTVITNVEHLRIKESDRLAAMVGELNRLGAQAKERGDGLEVDGSWFGDGTPTQETRVESHGDHRIAMSLAICGLRRPGVIIESPAVVGKSYPEFWDHLGSLLEA